MSKPSKELSRLFAELDAIYAQLPMIICRGRCGIACGPVPLTELEARRLQLATHKKPRVVNENRCVYLTANERCSAYAVRPLICRVWGLSRMMSCMHGCLPDQWLKADRFLEIAKQVERLGGRTLYTAPEGLVYEPGYDFTHMTITTPLETIEANEARTRNLRALHGGSILLASED